MANRILLSNSGIKVSKATYDVTTTAAANLSLDSTATALGVFQTGTATGYAGCATVVNFPNTLGYIPFVVVQQIKSTNVRVSGGYEENDLIESIEDTAPPTTSYWVESLGGEGCELLAVYNTSFVFYTYGSGTFRYVIFYTGTANGFTGTAITPDVTPTAMIWDDITGSTGVNTVGQVVNNVNYPLTFRLLSSSNVSGGTVRVYVNDIEVTSMSGGTTVDFNVKALDRIYFRVESSDWDYVRTFTVSNVTDSNATLDTFTASLNPSDWLPNTVAIATLKGTTVTSGTATGTISTETLTGFNRANNPIKFVVNTTMLSGESLKIYKNGVLNTTMTTGTETTVNFNSGDTYYVSFASTAALTTKVLQLRATNAGNAVIANYYFWNTVTNVDIAPTAVNWNNVTGVVNAGTNVVTMSSFVGTITLGFTGTADIKKNGSVITPGSFGPVRTFDVSSGDTIQFSGTGDIYTPDMGGTVYNMTNGAVSLDSFTMTFTYDPGGI